MMKRVVGNKGGRGTIIVSALLLLTIFAVAANYMAVNDVSAATSPSLGTATSFAVLAYSKVDNTGPTVVTGDLGLSPTTGAAITGFPPGTVIGTIYAVDAFGPAGSVDNPGLLTTAKTDETTAYNSLSQTCTAGAPFGFGGGNVVLDGMSLVPGVYCADTFSLSGTLTLSGSGVWIFRAGSSLTTTTGANVVGGDPCNVWWQVPSSATLGTNTELTGNILAYASITLGTGATLKGRALVQTAAVTLDSNLVNAACVLPVTLTVSGTTTITSVTVILSVISGQTSTLVVAVISGRTVLLPFLAFIPEYPVGVLLLLILMLPVYMLLKRGSQNSVSKSRSQKRA